jgi:hypothetical protein
VPEWSRYVIPEFWSEEAHQEFLHCSALALKLWVLSIKDIWNVDETSAYGIDLNSCTFAIIVDR